MSSHALTLPWSGFPRLETVNAVLAMSPCQNPPKGGHIKDSGSEGRAGQDFKFDRYDDALSWNGLWVTSRRVRWYGGEERIYHYH